MKNILKKILLIESDQALRYSYLKALSGKGYKVLEVENPEKAMKIIHDESPDLIVSPENILGFDGVKLLEILKRKKLYAPVILTSTAGSDRQSFRLWSSGAEVSKAGDACELELKIRRLLNS